MLYLTFFDRGSPPQHRGRPFLTASDYFLTVVVGVGVPHKDMHSTLGFSESKRKLNLFYSSVKKFKMLFLLRFTLTS